MRRLRLILWRYWTVGVCAVAMTASMAAIPPRALSPPPSRAIDVVMPENPAPLVEVQPGCFLDRTPCAALALPA